MKKNKDEMLDEYDFAGRKGVRGKYVNALKNGYSVRVYDGKKLIRDQFYAVIDTDIREYFSDSRAVNKALRTIISMFPKARKPSPRTLK